MPSEGVLFAYFSSKLCCAVLFWLAKDNVTLEMVVWPNSK